MTGYGFPDADDDGAPAQGEVTPLLRGRGGSPYAWPKNYTPHPPSATSATKATNPSTVEPSSARRIFWWVCMVVAVCLTVPALAAFWLDRGSKDPWQLLGLSAAMLAAFGLAFWGYSARCKTTGQRVVFCQCAWHSQE